ncbi:DUF349 domain-containing protein [Alteromonas sp. a30]|uniref:DUF349 domain-containing protein n=1 Tax=Alteromonas sp. a30 TaxID=2730917 RepID=UPI002282F579|nr:DUF349 domain-containing protein [Alteromonas sp. a30]MCY7294020.1 DUF349 domain-containing protein [Alteromonas sp. a30]
MIFKRLFQPKHQHKDPAVRIQALQQLNPQEPQQKTILHELAFNDSEASVSLAALGRLNNFDLWWKMANTAKDQRIAKKARAKVENALLGNDISNDGVALDNATRRTFILECQDNALLELLLQERALDENDTELMLAVIDRLNKPQITLKLLLSTANFQLSEALLNQLTDEADIARVARKANHADLVALANKKLAAFEEQKVKPVQITKDVRLVLSKLLALCDVNEYPKLVAEKEALTARFAALTEEFNWLSEDVRSEFEQKFADIQSRVARKAELLHEDWARLEIKRQLQKALEQAQNFGTVVVDEINQLLNNDVTQLTLGELERCNQQIEKAVSQLDMLLAQELSEPERQQLQSVIFNLEQKRNSLDDLPALQLALKQAVELQQQIKDKAQPSDVAELSDAKQFLHQMTMQWKEIKAPYKGIWPSQVETEWQNLLKHWKKAFSKIEKQVEEDFKKCRDKLNFVNGQINQGRFHSAMRHYEKLAKQFDNLNDSAKKKLSKAFENVRSQVENLKGWQEYIAQPRKPEILAEVEALAKSPLLPEEQAKRVKALRYQWTTLGNLGSEEDEQMNKAFDDWCEEAFKPCRAFYAEQDAAREQNLQKKMALLDTLEATNADDVSLADLDRALATFRKQWKNIGETDYKAKESVDTRYKSVVGAVKSKVDVYYQENAALKQALIDQAQALLVEDDWKQATQKAKLLQEEWKGVGRVQSKVEKSLWETFRNVNDQIFAKRDQVVEQQNALFEANSSALQEQIQEMETRIADAKSPNDIAELEQAFVELDNALAQLPHALSKSLKAKVRNLKTNLAEKRKHYADNKTLKVYQSILDALAAWEEGEAELDAEVGNAWKQAFAGKVGFEQGAFDGFDRAALTLVMEITAGVESPDSEHAKRKDIQLQLMASKLQDGEALGMDALLQLWISQGPLSPEDKALLSRVTPLFLAK